MHVQPLLHTHPAPLDHLAERADAVLQALDCGQACTACADACLAEEGDMGPCIRRCLDCADLCAAVVALGSRQTAGDSPAFAALLEACVAACRACGDACASHADTMDHCRHCADACRACEQACNTLRHALA
ncbi:MAG: four-helix bundle copper-binding protein [Rubricoccaceae bacterium]|nr:four-helix bundle copper-binding protein [Rubricoccaceae bacterium]